MSWTSINDFKTKWIKKYGLVVKYIEVKGMHELIIYTSITETARERKLVHVQFVPSVWNL